MDAKLILSEIQNLEIKRNILLYGIPFFTLIMKEVNWGLIVSLSDSKDHKFVMISDSVYSILGYKPHEMIDRKFTDFVSPEFKDDSIKEAKEMKRANSKQGYYSEYIHKKGHKVAILWEATAKYIDDSLVAAIGKEVSLK